MNHKAFAVAKSWVGSGSGGAGTDFNTGANWNPAGVPGAGDDVTIAMTSAGTCSLSANVTVNNFTMTVTNNNLGVFDVQTSIITINGTTVTNAIMGFDELDFVIEATGAGAIFKGPATFHTTGNGVTLVYGSGATHGSMTFFSDLTIGVNGRTSPGTEPNMFFDAPVSQTITVNNTLTLFLGQNLTFGVTNSPTVTFAGAPNPDWFGVYDGGLSINNSTIVQANNDNLPRYSGGGVGTFAMSAGSRLEINSTFPFPGFDAGSGFAVQQYPTYSLNPTSTTIYLGTASAQTVTGLTYGHLISG
ncbi:MAG TPA: hypothetical protein VNX68_01355, partial [Nitrosopumilaceae archaeon]|nr:hypothetical protein [Nitrosopumilaceae archaeon]